MKYEANNKITKRSQNAKNNQYETFDRADDNVQHCEFSGKKISQAIILRSQIFLYIFFYFLKIFYKQ